MKISAMPTTKRLSLPFNGRVCFKCVWWILVSFTYWPSCGHLHITKWKNWALRYQAPRDTRKINDTWSLNPKVFKTFFVLQFFFLPKLCRILFHLNLTPFHAQATKHLVTVYALCPIVATPKHFPFFQTMKFRKSTPYFSTSGSKTTEI